MMGSPRKSPRSGAGTRRLSFHSVARVRSPNLFACNYSILILALESYHDSPVCPFDGATTTLRRRSMPVFIDIGCPSKKIKNASSEAGSRIWIV